MEKDQSCIWLWEFVGQFPLILFSPVVQEQTAESRETEDSSGWFIAGWMEERNCWPLRDTQQLQVQF